MLGPRGTKATIDRAAAACLSALRQPARAPLTDEEILVSSFVTNSFAWSEGRRIEAWCSEHDGHCYLCGRQARDLTVRREFDARADRHIRAHLREGAGEIRAMIALAWLDEAQGPWVDTIINVHVAAIARAFQAVVGAPLGSADSDAFWRARGNGD